MILQRTSNHALLLPMCSLLQGKRNMTQDDLRDVIIRMLILYNYVGCNECSLRVHEK